MAINKNLVGYYPLDINSDDYLGLNDGTDTAVTYSGGAAVYNGSTAFTALGNVLNFGTGDFTVAAWIKVASTPPSDPHQSDVSYGAKPIIHWKWTYPDTGWSLTLWHSGATYVIPNADIIQFHLADGTIGGPVETTIPGLSTWFHVAAVRSGTSMILYLNGVAVHTLNTWATPNVSAYATNLQFGGAEYPGPGDPVQDFFDGSLKEVAFWDRAVTAPEVTAIYNAGVAGNPLSSLFPVAVVPDIAGAPAVPATFDGSGSTNVDYYHWSWQHDVPTPFPDNQAATPLDMTDNEGLWHFEEGAVSYTQDFESTSVGSLPAGFVTSGDANWEVETGDDVAGAGKAAVSQDINDNQDSIMEYTTTLAVDSRLSFYWKCSTEVNYDYLEFKIDGVQQAQISGTVGWTDVNFLVAAGARTFTWRYYKDGSVTHGDDHGKVDQIVIRETAFGDTSGNGRNGTGTGGNLVAGKVGAHAYHFGAADNINFGAASTFISANFSISFWLKGDAAWTPSTDDSIMGASNAFIWNEGFGIYWTNATTIRCFVDLYSTTPAVEMTVVAEDWNHIVMTWDGADIKAYLNGSLASTRAHSAALTGLANDFFASFIGNHGGGEQTIDELAIWSRAISASEVSGIYAVQGVGPLLVPSGSTVDNAPIPFPDNGATTPLNMTDNVALWHFEGNANDTSGDGNNGTVSGATQVAGKVGSNAYSFDGISDYIDVGSNFAYTTEDFSFSFWVQEGASQSGFVNIFGNQSGGWPWKGFCLENDSSGSHSYRIVVGGMSWTFGPAVALTPGVWTHLAITRSGTIVSIYRDGVLAATSNGFPSPFPAAVIPMYLGANQYWGNYWNGILDEFAIWERALGAIEVFSIYKAQSGTIAGVGDSAFTFTPDIVGTYTANLEIADSPATSTNADAVIASAAGGGGGPPGQGGGLQGNTLQGFSTEGLV